MERYTHRAVATQSAIRNQYGARPWTVRCPCGFVKNQPSETAANITAEQHNYVLTGNPAGDPLEGEAR